MKRVVVMVIVCITNALPMNAWAKVEGTTVLVNGSGMTVAEDIQHEANTDNADNSAPIQIPVQKETQPQEMTSNHENTNDEAGRQMSTSTLTPALEHNDFKETLPQVVRQTENIGTAEHPTIDGGLISAPELAQALPEAGQEATSLAAANDADLIIAIELSHLYFYWQNFRQDDFSLLFSHAKIKGEIHLQKVWLKYKQIWRRWMTLRISHTHVKTKVHKRRVVKTTVKTKQPRFMYKRAHHDNG